MPATMKAAVLHALRTPLIIERVPVPDPGHGELLVKVTACGVCHSDVHAVDGDWTPPPVLPLIPGHEVAGTVAGHGTGVSDFAIGDRVGVPWMYSSCGSCEFCLAGMETICKSAEATGYSRPGGYAEYLIAPAAFVGRLPAGVDPYEMAPILCAGVTTYRGLKRTNARPGQWCAVVGIGGLGHIAVQYARAMGMRVIAVDVSDDKLALAKSLGAEEVVNGATEDPAVAVQARIGGAHGAVVTATAARAFEQAIGMLRPGGTVSYIGLPGGKSDEIRVSIAQITNWELSVRGSNVGTRADLNEAIAFAANGLVKAKVETAALEDINGIFDTMRKGKILGRVVLKLA
jgi:alcohol dehydrogenase, propanol-preferring